VALQHAPTLVTDDVEMVSVIWMMTADLWAEGVVQVLIAVAGPI